MIEIQGNLWDFYGRLNTTVLITTNGSVRKDGWAVMGRGCTKQAAKMFPEFPEELGKFLRENDNEIYRFNRGGVWTFPVKHIWNDAASLPLIRKTTQRFEIMAIACPRTRFILPRPGCGYGHRLWIEVEPIVRILPDNVLVISYAR